MAFSYQLSPQKFNSYVAKISKDPAGSSYLQEHRNDAFELLRNHFEEIHQYAFTAIRGAINKNPYITRDELKSKLQELEIECIKGTETEFLGIEDNLTLLQFANTVYDYSVEQGYIVDGPAPIKEESSGPVAKPLDSPKVEFGVNYAQQKKEDDEVTAILKAFHKWLGDLIETRSAS